MFHSGRAVQKLFYIGVQRLGKFRQHFHVRPGPAGLIVGYGLTGDVEHLRQLILTDVPLLPQRADVFPISRIGVTSRLRLWVHLKSDAWTSRFFCFYSSRKQESCHAKSLCGVKKGEANCRKAKKDACKKQAS